MWVKNVRGGKEKWIPGTIVAMKGPETSLVRVSGDNCRFVHANHLIPDDTREQNANQSVYEPLNLENGSFLNSDNFDATDWRF